MGFAKVLGILLLIIFLIIGIIGVDIYMTYNTLSNADLSNAVSNPTFDVSDDNSTVTVSITVDLPKAGFIPKGVNIALTVDFDGDSQTQETNVALGDSKTISLTFVLTEAHAQTLTSGGSITVSAGADVTPTVFSIAISQLTQTIDLGSQTISA